MWRYLLLFLLAGGSFVALVQASLLTGSAQTYAPNQADRGAVVFAAHCEVCHGDVGQGLDKWRLTWDEAHQNCSNYKCHGKDYPPGGFYLPNNYAPALIGDHTLDRFQTARDLYAFISSRMPYQEPGTLPAEDYWALAAFLMRDHGIAPTGRVLAAANANSVPLHPTSPASPVHPAVIGLVALVPTALGVLVFRYRHR
jgi:mono/diheme cytochrome c family protein